MIEGHPELLRVAAEFRELVVDLLRDGDRDGAHDAIKWAFDETAAFRPRITEDDPVSKVTSPVIARIFGAGGVHTIGDLCEHSIDELTARFQVRRKTVSLIELNLDLIGFALSRD
ncbi:hypothetical protein [Rhodopirellula sp. P2]|uniref:hypothetical protein n=1 Tax=Rhodopirellula sp. P2 TaxID=2127060 RepID=UPI002368E784|nr:hypothetical protein [Rhodopirellula sp. P2]WDQ16388.1 hypothetical protein PSR62_22595 [Rhodopirellula sp. P2]